MKLSTAACDIGKGLFAGFAGTLAITASQMIEMKLRGRKPSMSPAQAVCKIFDIEPKDEDAEKRLSNLVHFAYGTSWGAFRGLLGAAGLAGPAAAAVHFAAIFGTALVMLPALKVAPPVSEWGATEIAIDAWHHLVYVVATNRAYEALGD